MYFEYNGERFKVLRADVTEGEGKPGEILDGEKALKIVCGEQVLEVCGIQRQGNRPMTTEELLRGMKFSGILQ